MLKRLFLTTMIVSVTAFGALSCSDSSSDEEENTTKENTTTENPSVTTQDGNNASQSQDDGTGTENTENKTENQSSAVSFESIVGKSFTFTTGSGPHTLKFESDSEIVYTMYVEAQNVAYKHYLTYDYEKGEDDVYTVTGYIHDDTPETPSDKSGNPSTYKIKIVSGSEILINDKNTATVLDSKEYTVEAALSCYVNAMGGVDFGTQVYKGTKIKYENGFYTATVELGTGTGNIYGIDHLDFVDTSNSTPGYYNKLGKVTNAEYTMSAEDETATNSVAEGNEQVRYATSMSFPVSKDVSEYNLWIYINSNVMGVQFCDGSGEAGSGEPNVATKYVGKITIDWDSLN